MIERRIFLFLFLPHFYIGALVAFSANSWSGHRRDSSAVWQRIALASCTETEHTPCQQDQAIQLAAALVTEALQMRPRNKFRHLFRQESPTDDQPFENNNSSTATTINSTLVAQHVRGKFMDLTCTARGEQILENIFLEHTSVLPDYLTETAWNGTILNDAIAAVQSLAIMGMQVGVTGTPEKIRRMVAHLRGSNSVWQLKSKLDREPALRLLSQLLWKRTPQGAFDLMVALGAWEIHEDLPLLRSGFSLRFPANVDDMNEHPVDLDSLLGIRQDLRHLKVYTIDGPTAAEIDDGVSLEVLEAPDGTKCRRLWIHIADADRWAPRNSHWFELARQRVTSVYTPSRCVPMFPSAASQKLMSLTETDCCALSMGVELNNDGSIRPSSLVLTPSLIDITYRLTYDDVDEMLAEGTGYNEEWELGAMLDMAKIRREFRIAKGSTEGIVPYPIPYSTVSTYQDASQPDGVGITVKVEVSHNAGKNETIVAETTDDPSRGSAVEASVSSATLLVTESMILAGEALSQWQSQTPQGSTVDTGLSLGSPRLPFRSQKQPDFNARQHAHDELISLLENRVGGGYCHAWFCRRFLEPVQVSETKLPHSGLGLGSYVQWTSPIRRFGDLQVHSIVKRYLRRKRVLKLLQTGHSVPPEVNPIDLGLDPNTVPSKEISLECFRHDASMDCDIDLREGGGLIKAARVVQRQSQQYWLFEYIRRKQEVEPEKVYDALVLGCIDSAKGQFAIYIYEIGLEHRYTSPGETIYPGAKLRLKVGKVVPRGGLLNFVSVF